MVSTLVWWVDVTHSKMKANDSNPYDQINNSAWSFLSTDWKSVRQKIAIFIPHNMAEGTFLWTRFEVAKYFSPILAWLLMGSPASCERVNEHHMYVFSSIKRKLQMLKEWRYNSIKDSWTMLTHWGRVTLICVSKLTIIGWHQAIIWTNAGILLTGTLGTNLSEILNDIQTFSLKKRFLKMSSEKWRPFCLGLNVLRQLNMNTGICRWHSRLLGTELAGVLTEGLDTGEMIIKRLRYVNKYRKGLLGASYTSISYACMFYEWVPGKIDDRTWKLYYWCREDINPTVA